MSHYEATVRTELPLDEHPDLMIHADWVDATIEPLRPGERPYIVTSEGVGVDVRTDGTDTRVRLDHDWGFFGLGRRGHARVELHVPANIALIVRSSGGRVRAERLEGCRMAIESDAGEILLRDVSGSLRLSTEAGRIDGTGLRGTFEVRTSAGAVRLEILELDPGVHRIQTSVGAQRIELARGMPVWIEGRASMGSVRVKYPTTKGAPAMLELGADLGSIKVTEARATWTARTDDAAPYRSPPKAPVHDEAEVEAVLRRVADGSLSPSDGAALLRSLGHA